MNLLGVESSLRGSRRPDTMMAKEPRAERTAEHRVHVSMSSYCCIVKLCEPAGCDKLPIAVGAMGAPSIFASGLLSSSGSVVQLRVKGRVPLCQYLMVVVPSKRSL